MPRETDTSWHTPGSFVISRLPDYFILEKLTKNRGRKRERKIKNKLTEKKEEKNATCVRLFCIIFTPTVVERARGEYDAKQRTRVFFLLTRTKS